MKKRLTVLLLALSMVASMAGCGKSYKIDDKGAVYNDYVKVKQWKELEVEKVEPAAVSDADVEASIESDIQSLTTYKEITDRGAKEGDQVTIDYVGKLDGKEFDGGKDNDVKFILGKASFVEGFQEGIVGHKAGDTFDVPLTFPKDYYEELAGKDVVFTMTLKKVEEVDVPELSDEVANKLNPKAKTVDEYKALVKADLEASNKQTAEQTMKDSLASLLYEQSSATKYPEDRLEDMVDNVEESYTNYFEYAVSQYGMTLDSYLQQTGSTLADMMKSMTGETFEDVAKRQLCYEMAIELVAEVEGIEIEDKEYEEFLEQKAEEESLKDGAEFEKKYEENFGKDSCRAFCLQEKVTEFLWENCKIVEPKKTDNEATTK